jgi:two-component system chemotaxis response regulator CheY
VIRSVLSRLGLDNVDEAQDGVQGLRLFKLVHYHLVVTDLYMPNLDGMELLEAIRALPGREMTPVLMVSGQLTERNLREALDLGVDGFVAKPFVEAPLVEKVTRLLLMPLKRKAAEAATTDFEVGLMGGISQRGLA